MKNKGEKILEKALAKEFINLFEVFEILFYNKIIITKELTSQIKIKVVDQSLLKIQSFEEIAKASALKSIIKNIKNNFKIITTDFGSEINMIEVEILKKNIIAILNKELNLIIKSDEDKKLPKIQINCETTVLYALFEQLNNEIFIGDNLNHRISQIISQNFIGKDQNIIDQKTIYNKLRIGATERANKSLYIILERISKKIK